MNFEGFSHTNVSTQNGAKNKTTWVQMRMSRLVWANSNNHPLQLWWAKTHLGRPHPLPLVLPKNKNLRLPLAQTLRLSSLIVSMIGSYSRNWFTGVKPSETFCCCSPSTSRWDAFHLTTFERVIEFLSPSWAFFLSTGWFPSQNCPVLHVFFFFGCVWNCQEFSSF